MPRGFKSIIPEPTASELSGEFTKTVDANSSLQTAFMFTESEFLN